MIIEDGTGTRVAAKVDSKNRLLVSSRSEAAEQSEAADGLAFILSAECYVKNAASGGLLYIKNNDPLNEIRVTRIYTYPWTLSNSNIIITQSFDATVAGGEDVSSSLIINKNRGSSETLTAQMLISSSGTALTYSNVGAVYHSYPAVSRTMNSRTMNGTNILPAGKSILFGFKSEDGSSLTDGQVIAFSVNITKVPL